MRHEIYFFSVIFDWYLQEPEILKIISNYLISKEVRIAMQLERQKKEGRGDGERKIHGLINYTDISKMSSSQKLDLVKGLCGRWLSEFID